MRHAPAQGRDHIVQRGRAGRRDQADAARHQRQRPLAVGIEQAFAFQLRFQPQELLEQRALPGPLHALDDQLEIAPRLVHADTPAQLDQFAVARLKV